MNITYVQIEPDFIQASETNENGSFTSGIIRRHETRKNAEGIDYSPWDELDPDLVAWLDLPAYEAEQAEAAALASFKATRQALIDNAVVNANGFKFDADEVSIGRMLGRIFSAIDEPDDYLIEWSLADTATGFMTDITLADLKLAHKLAVINMASVWGV